MAAVALGERIERGVEGPHYISLIRLTARGGFATIAPAVSFDVLKVTTTSVAGEGLLVTALVVVQIALLPPFSGKGGDPRPSGQLRCPGGRRWHSNHSHNLSY